MKIVYFIIAYGSEYISNDVHEELGLRMREQGHEFVALTLTNKGDAPLQRTESANGIPIYKIKVGGSSRGLAQRLLHYNNFFAVLHGYERFLREYPNADIIHAEAAYPLGAIAMLGTPKGGPRIIPNLQGADVLNYPQVDYGYGRYRIPRLLLRRTFARAAAVRCNSELTRDVVIRDYGCPSHKAAVILRNIGAWSFLPASTDVVAYRAAARSRVAQLHPQLHDRTFILSMSRLHPFKGIEYLIEALALDESQSKILMVAGPGRSTEHFGDYAAFLQRKVNELRVADRVLFTGEIANADSRDYLAAADVVAVSSVVDALNKVVLEAAAVGTPTLLTTTTGAADYVAQAGIGLAVPPQSGPALAAGLARLLASDIPQQAMQRGPAWAEQFRSAPIADNLLRLYEGVIGRSFH